MKAKIDINEAIIKQALMLLFEKMSPQNIVLKGQQNYDRYDNPSGIIISGTIEVELGDIVAH